MDKKFPESGRLLNLCTRIGLFSLKISKSSAESEGLAALHTCSLSALLGTLPMRILGLHI